MPADDASCKAPGRMTGQGKAACAQFFAGRFEAFPDAHVQVHDLHIAGDAAAPVAVDYIQALRFRDGKHLSFNLMFDRLVMLEQLGLLPAAAPTG